MALNKLKFNSINVTPAASKAIRFNSSANGLETADAGGSLVKIATTTASSSSSVSFTSGLTSTHKEYIFIFNNIHPASAANFTFNLSVDSGSNYNVTKTTTNFYAYHNESGSDQGLSYNSGLDLAQGTGYQILGNVASANDASCSGFLHLFEPSSTTFVKNFISRVNVVYPAGTEYTSDYFTAGYGNTTSAIDAIDFKMASGNIDSGTITMYGFK
tara:strand:- start:44 stop:688 length:645 start_codon:yes stop_codon:yes gene_type:complete